MNEPFASVSNAIINLVIHSKAKHYKVHATQIYRSKSTTYAISSHGAYTVSKIRVSAIFTSVTSVKQKKNYTIVTRITDYTK